MLTGRGRGSGLVLDMRIGRIWTFEDGQVVRYEDLRTWSRPSSSGAAGVGDVAGEGTTSRLVLCMERSSRDGQTRRFRYQAKAALAGLAFEDARSLV